LSIEQFFMHIILEQKIFLDKAVDLITEKLLSQNIPFFNLQKYSCKQNLIAFFESLFHLTLLNIW